MGMRTEDYTHTLCSRESLPLFNWGILTTQLDPFKHMEKILENACHCSSSSFRFFNRLRQPRLHIACSVGCHQSKEDLQSGFTKILGVWCSKIQCPTEWPFCFWPLPFLVFPLPFPLPLSLLPASGRTLGPSRGGNCRSVSFEVWEEPDDAVFTRTKLKNVRSWPRFLSVEHNPWRKETNVKNAQLIWRCCSYSNPKVVACTVYNDNQIWLVPQTPWNPMQKWTSFSSTRFPRTKICTESACVSFEGSILCCLRFMLFDRTYIAIFCDQGVANTRRQNVTPGSEAQTTQLRKG